MSASLGWLMASLLVAVGLAAWVVQRALVDGMARYRALFTETATVRMSELFLFIDAERLWAANLVLAAWLGAMSGVASGSGLVAGVGAAVGLALPVWAMRQARRRRARRFDAQLPDALFALANALRAGASLQSGLRQAVAYGSAPLAQELGLMLREQRLGVPFETALDNVCGRMPTDAMRLVGAALRIAADTGGNLAEALERIGLTVRARLHMEGRVRALTAQARLQARVVGALPLLLIAVLAALEPDSMRLLWTTAAGALVLAVIAALEIAGMWMIARLVRIDA